MLLRIHNQYTTYSLRSATGNPGILETVLKKEDEHEPKTLYRPRRGAGCGGLGGDAGLADEEPPGQADRKGAEQGGGRSGRRDERNENFLKKSLLFLKVTVILRKDYRIQEETNEKYFLQIVL